MAKYGRANEPSAKAKRDKGSQLQESLISLSSILVKNVVYLWLKRKCKYIGLKGHHSQYVQFPISLEKEKLLRYVQYMHWFVSP